MRHLTHKLGLSLVVPCVLFLNTQAMAITVSESTDYPGGSSFPGLNVGTLTAGSNSVAGALSGNCVPGDCNSTEAGDTQDSFTFTVASGFALNSLFVTTSNVAGPQDFTVSFALRSPGTSLVFVPFLPLNSTTLNLLMSSLGAGTYSASVFGQGASEAGPYFLDWTITMGAAPIPEASTWGMMLAGLGFVGLGVRRRLR